VGSRKEGLGRFNGGFSELTETSTNSGDWFCEKCPLDTQGNNLGPWKEDNSQTFQNVRRIHEKHSGWQCGKPKPNQLEQLEAQANQETKKILDNFLEELEEIKRIKKLDYIQYYKEASEKLQRLLEIINKYFEGRQFGLEVCLSVKAQLLIEDVTQPFALILMGSPSTSKTTILEIVNSLPDCYKSDKFTPKSFVSHSANVKKKELGKIDLLPRIKHKTLITPELAPMFSGNEDSLVENFGVLTRVLDGQGLVIDSGVHGRRGYTGDYCFMMLGAVVDIPHKVWKVLGNLGPRLYFFRLSEDKLSTKQKREKN